MSVRLLAAVGLALLLAGGIALYGLASAGPPELHGTSVDPPLEVSADLVLASADGPVRLDDFQGQIVVLFFGYTSCPDVCPLTLQRAARALELLGPEADEVRVVFVSVDPERDTPARAAEYTSAFGPRVTGLSGTPEQIRAAAAAFGIYHARGEPSSEGGYLVDHTVRTLVLDRDGALRLIWPDDVSAEAMAADLRYLLRS